MQVRYRYRIYPSTGQQQALARVFGCARMVYNDCLRLRDECHARGERLSDAEVQRRVVTLAKLTPERSWLSEVASVALVQVCSECGVLDGSKPLSVRTWQCAACGAVHDRDVNAARNILAAGRADRLNACRGDLRPGPALAVACEAGTYRGVA